ncbi:hypothetical protein [Pedobacter metabolipauper]|uniref:Uncharacterized protein n=1 Tax=Pedobacter metabolipauper TaxID=425513 RepID=A0A4R6SWM1_9SPHI|nr:hypothetical protein [Pedobacter metabolipauper]TDQ09533.1 hypothetical protein ATK78_1689 [Pedobacter metabolipauper]
MEKRRKYKIDEEMNKLNLPDYKSAIKIIPRELGIAFNTFHNYRKLLIEDTADIPYEKVRKLECLFGMESGGLINGLKPCKNLKELIYLERQQNGSEN